MCKKINNMITWIRISTIAHSFPRCTSFLFFIVCLKPKYDLLTSHSVRDVCGSNLQTNLEDIKSHRRVYCIEFSFVDKVSFLATEAIVLSVIYFKTRDPINNQSIDVQTLVDMMTLNLVGFFFPAEAWTFTPSSSTGWLSNDSVSFT